ncbi:hypothetical protein GGI07_005918, partial [Coemansia sp. Benny D115]
MHTIRSAPKRALQQGAKAAMAAQPSYPLHASASTCNGCGSPRTVNETELFREFIDIFNNLVAEYKKLCGEVDPLPSYELVSREDTPFPDSKIKPDGALFFASTADKTVADVHIVFKAIISEGFSVLPDDALGQMAEYSHGVWSAQPTRTFVPVFLLHGGTLSLFVFLRFGVSRLNLESILYRKNWKRHAQTRQIAECLLNFMFFIQQTPSKFGHFVDRPVPLDVMIFSGSKDQAKAEALETYKPGALLMKERVTNRVPLLGRAAYIYKVEWNDGRAVLKLSWIPHDRQPEGAVYDILKHRHVSGIPKVYGSGILIRDFFGCRLEYILMEYCGATVDVWTDIPYWHSVHENHNISEPAGFVDIVVNKVSSCLSQAKLAGVLHRDISAGNVAVNRNGDVFVIDWGYSRPVCNVLDPVVRGRVEKDWQIDLLRIANTEKQFDAGTGTRYFMSIRILSGHGDRSILDDLESLFYVALAMFASWYPGSLDYKLAKLKNASDERVAMAKVCDLKCRHKYPTVFGVDPEHSQSVCKALEPLYNMLFIRDDAFIGPRLANIIWDIRCQNDDPLWSVVDSLCTVDGFGGLRTATDTLKIDT